MNASLDQALWISSPVCGGPRTGAPAPYLRRTFRLDRPVKAARLHATALGLYEAEINGHRVGNRVFAPGWTSYGKRVAVQDYDVLSFLQTGENAFGAILGDGWYCGNLGWWGRQQYGDRPEFLAVLEITLDDGTSLVVSTDAAWKTTTGPILESDMQMGESYDARREPTGWSQPGFDDTDWEPVRTRPQDSRRLDPDPVPPVLRQGEFHPALCHSFGQTRIYDMGQNFSGRIRIRVRSRPGHTLVFRHAEILNPDKSLYTANLRGARATDHYTCRGGGEEVWEPRFTFHGFRYMEASGCTEWTDLEVTGIVLHSDIPATGSFSCSNPLLNQLQHNIQWGQKGNFLEAPTDCPQRDERLGWTGDAQVFVRTACFNADVRAFFHKWLRDMRDDQHPEGALGRFIPNGWAETNPLEIDSGPAWSDAMVICPWTVYLCYGDRRIIEDHYGAMCRWHRFISEKRTLGHIRCHPDVDPFGGFGDWLALDGSGDIKGGTPKDLIGTAFYAHCTGLLAKISRVLGQTGEAERLASLHGEIVAAFRRRYLTPAGLVASGTQTAYALALKFGLIPVEQRSEAVADLVRLIELRKDHIGTGFAGTSYLLDALAENGRIDVAYRLLEQETPPSWLFPVKNGATTIWERWDGWTPDKGFQDPGMNSFNHYAYGAVGDWMYRNVAGLDLDEDEPGYRHLLLKPRPGGSLTHAGAALDTPHGRAAISWKRRDDRVDLEFTVPEGCRATLFPPEGLATDTEEYGPGTHTATLSPA